MKILKRLQGYLGFENGIFTSVSGSGTPSLLTFSKNDKQEYVLKSCEIAMDGSEYGESLKKMFNQKAIRELDTIQKGSPVELS